MVNKHYLILAFLFIVRVSNLQAQLCPDDLLNYSGDMSGGWGYWTKQSNWRNDFGSSGYAYIDLDGATNRLLYQPLTGLSNSNTPYVVEFDIWSNNYNNDLSRTGTTGTLVFSLGGVTYATFVNNGVANGNVSVSTAGGASCNISSFPVTLIEDEAWTHVVLSFNYSGSASGNFQFSFSSSPPDGDDFAIDNVTLCNNCPYDVTGNIIEEGPQTVCSGSVAATITGYLPDFGGSPTQQYQWQYSSSPTGPWTNIPGATSQNYSPGIVTTTRYYRRIAKSSCYETYSDSYLVTVLSKPNVGSDATVSCTGTNTTYSLTGSPNTGTWTALSGNPTGASLGATTSGVATVTFSNASSGAYSFVYTLPNDCKDTIVLNFDACILLSGNVFNDNDGLVDNTVDGSLISNLLGTALYVNVVKMGVVIEVITLNPDGTFIGSAPKNSTITLEISTTAGVVGLAPPSITLPSNWTTTGENLGSGTGNDGTADGNQQVSITTSNISEINFGLERLPESDDKSQTIAEPTPDSYLTLDGSGANPPALSGSDPEDGSKGAGSKLQIVTLPTNGKLVYDGVELMAGDIITNYDPSKLQIQFTGGGYTTTSFTYAIIDNADKQDPTPATYSLSWSGSPLPVNFVYVTANVSRYKTVLLEFKTANENGINSFIIEKSVNGIDWYNLGQLEPKNSSSNAIYKWTDFTPKEENLYRIKVINLDNTVSYSIIKRAMVSFSGNPNIFPNPAHTFINITDAKPNSTVQIYSTAGKLIQETKIEKSNQTVDISKFMKGVYMLKISQNNVVYYNSKLVVKN